MLARIFLSYSDRLQALRKKNADLLRDCHFDSRAPVQGDQSWPLHPDVSSHLHLDNPTSRAQHEFLSRLETEAQQAALSLCSQATVNAAGNPSIAGHTCGESIRVLDAANPKVTVCGDHCGVSRQYDSGTGARHFHL